MADFITGTGSASSFDEKRYVEIAGTSTETKPTGAFLTGSIFVEVDTGKVYFYNASGSTWVEQFSFQG